MTFKYVVLTAAIILASPALRGSTTPSPEPLFGLKLDGSIKPRGKLQAIEIKKSGSRQFESGKPKSGMEINSGTISFKLAKPLVLKQGSIAFWFRPAEWDGNSFVIFLRGFSVTNGKLKERLRIYVFPHHWIGLAVLEYLKPRRSTFCIRGYLDRWRQRPEQWRQFVFTWNDKYRKLYIDGLEVASRDIGGPLDIGSQINIGGPTYRYDKSHKRILTHGKTVVSELCIYDRTLSPEKIRTDYEQVMGPLIEKDKF